MLKKINRALYLWMKLMLLVEKGWQMGPQQIEKFKGH